MRSLAPHDSYNVFLNLIHFYILGLAINYVPAKLSCPAESEKIMKSLKVILPLLAVLTFALPSLACSADDNKSADHSACKMHKHKQHSKRDQAMLAAKKERHVIV